MASTASFHTGHGVRKGDWSTQGGLGMSTFVLIHGAGDVGWYWHLVEADLRERGHDTVAPDLPCDDDAAGLAEYTDAVVGAIGNRTDLVVVAQSLGGFTAPACVRTGAGEAPGPGRADDPRARRGAGRLLGEHELRGGGAGVVRGRHRPLLPGRSAGARV